MLHKKRIAISLSLVAFLATSSLAVAGEICASRPVTETIDPAVVALFDSYRDRFARVDELAEEAKDARAALHREFAAELGRIQGIENRFFFGRKSDQGCKTACEFLGDGLVEITAARGYALSGWTNDCPTSSYGEDAYDFADAATSAANDAHDDLCIHPPPSCDDLDPLVDAIDDAWDATQAALDAYQLDGCGSSTSSDMYQAYLEAFEAYTSFYNAEYHMATDCCIP